MPREGTLLCPRSALQLPRVPRYPSPKRPRAFPEAAPGVRMFGPDLTQKALSQRREQHVLWGCTKTVSSMNTRLVRSCACATYMYQ